ncbi:hypothetical protein GCM10022378_12020 [Salinicoccus jeotgali]|uniref:DUF5067 domain-containing protein n=1 Tax=Salinicoccus jeotgali TaxID=381634 RepID=A0ABP7ET04_9STAP
MSLRKYLLTGGLSAVLLLGACSDDGGSDEGQAEDEATGEESSGEASDESNENGSSEEGAVSYSGEYGDYAFNEFSQFTIEPEENEEESTEEGAEEPQPSEVVVIEFEFTNNSEVPTAPQEAFGLDLAVRQVAEGSESTLENMTTSLPEDFEMSEEAAAATETVEPGESATAVLAYGSVDPELETVLQSRENPMAEEQSEPLDHKIELEKSE